MREVKGSYLLWGTVAIYLLYLFFDFIGVSIIKLTVVAIISGIILGIISLLFYSQLVIPFMYASDCQYDMICTDKSIQYKNYYLHRSCTNKDLKWIKFSLIYWIVVMVLEVNNFCNKYFTFKL